MRKRMTKKERAEYIKKRYTAKVSTICVNLFAGAGAGKSTCATGVFTLLKHHNVNAEYVSEYAKRQFRLNGKVDVMVTDSPILLSSVYQDPLDELSHAMVMREFKKYNNLNFYIKRVKPYMKIGRQESFNGAKLIDNKVQSFLKREQIKYEERLGNNETVNHVTGLVLKQLGKKQEYFITRK